MVITTFKHNHKILCYIYQNGASFSVFTGKPSDVSVIEFCRTDNFEYAKSEAQAYVSRYTMRG